MPSADDLRAGGAEPLRYHQLHRLGRYGWPWALLGVVTLVVLVVLTGILTGAMVAIAALPFGADIDIDPLTPAGLAWVTLQWAVMIPAVLLLTWLLHRTPGATMSVARRLRWGWLFTCLGLAAVALGGALLLTLVLPERGGATAEGSLTDLTDRTVAFALLVVLLVPLQAAGEEFAFRGYLTQALGGVVPGRLGAAVAVVVPALIFALAHGAQDLPVFADRLMFGLVAGVLVIVTGGLEAGIAMHVLNNGVFFGLALAFGDIDEALAPIAGTWWLLPGTLVQSLGYLVLVTWAGRRRHVETTTQVGVLDAQRPRV